MLRAYFDRSEVPKYGAVTVAGWLTTGERWGLFEQRWREILHEFGVSQLHMTDYEGGHEEFRGWLPAKKAQFMQRLVGVLRVADPLGVSVGLMKADFDAVLTQDQQRVVPAFAVCAVNAIGRMMRWVKDQGSDQPIEFVLEAGDEGTGKILDGIAKARKKSAEFDSRILSVDREKKGNVWGLEAADFLAYEAAKQLPRTTGVDRTPPRKSLLRLLKRTKHLSVHLDVELLRIVMFTDWPSP